MTEQFDRRDELDDEVPVTLDDDRTIVDRNAAGGGWEGAGEQVENDFEVEQLRRLREEGELSTDPDADPDEGTPEGRVRY